MKETIQFNETITKAIQALGFTNFSPIQEKVLPILLEKQNVIIKAPTGTGKTHAFLLPILENLNLNLKQTQAIICVPTRELASQIERVSKEIIALMEQPITVYTLTGGKDREKSLEYLEKTQPQILIGTPGRLKDIIVEQKKVDIRAIKYIVLDETDMIIENGFIESLDQIFSMLVNPDKITFAVASATVSQEVEIFIKKYIKNIKMVEVKKNALANDKIEHLLVEVTGKNRQEVLLKVLETFSPYMALIFANTKKEVELLYTFLQDAGIKVGILHGDMKARERKQMLRRIENLEFQYVVASDIAARGIDIDGVSHVINYQIPGADNIEFYFHRAGRTGRMHYDGTIITFYLKEEQHIVDTLRKNNIAFSEVVLKKGELVARTSRRDKKEKVVDEKVLAISNKAKKGAHRSGKVKPGYKKKIKFAVQKAVRDDKRKTSKREKRNSKKK